MMVVHSSCNGMMDNLHPHTVLSRLSEQRSLGLFCDVTIVVEDIKFRAHRNVLAATSGYFHSVFTASETCSSSQVLEIPDLKSEVFASILNFIYSSKVDLASKGDHRSLIAAGKKLGIPFLEKLHEMEKQDSGMAQSLAFAKSENSPNQTKLSVCSGLKKEAPRPEEKECPKGPRITNAFSITEVLTVNNPFTSVDSRSNGHQSPEVAHQPQSGTPSAEGDSVDAMFEHSYAVSQGHQTSELKENVQENAKEVTKSVVLPCKSLTNHRLGPLKKRHRLCKGLAPISNQTSEFIQSPVSSPVVQNGPPDSTSMLQSPSSNSTLCSAPDLLPPPEILPLQDDDPPSLIPEDVPTSTTYRCQQCPEAFSSSALLSVHMQSHKRRFVSHLFCKYCCKKFMHLKRLRNHEQVCMKGLPQQEVNGKETPVSLDSSTAPILDDASFPSSDLQDPPHLDSTLSGPLEMHQEGVTKSSSQRAYKCSVCKRAYVTLSSLKRHENVHSWQRAYPCHYCNKVFALAEYRTKHEIWHTGERRYQCIFCLETFLTYYILKNHQKSFHGIDPRLAVNKKSANGGFKGSVYPIKLYRLLPMKFKKKRYKTYSKTYSEVMGDHEHSFTAPLDANSQDAPLIGTAPIRSPESATSSQSLFSMPVTFMATPKMVATELPHITFDQSVDTPLPSEKSLSHIEEEEGFNPGNTHSGLAAFQASVSPVFGCGYTPSLTTDVNTRSSTIMHRNDSSSTKCNGNTSRDVMPFLNIPPVCSFEGLSKLSELSAAAQTIEVMANQLLQPQPETLTQNLRPDGKTETYIAKPACPGPSVNNQVLPLCQITVKIGNEAIIRRKIKGSKLFPKRKKRRTWKQDNDRGNTAEDGMGFPNLRLRTDLSSSVTEDEPYEDGNDPENDKLWRPYYTYKPKKKGKRFRSKRKRLKAAQYYTKPLSPEPDEDFMELDCGLEEKVAAEGTDSRMALRSQSPKENYTCRCCNSSFSTSASLNMHIVKCHQPCCRICGKQCPSEELPNADVTFSGDFACQSCTEDGSCFNSTVMTLGSEKRYRCSYCPQRFLYLATKKSHEAKHLERFSTEHSCRYCNKVCKSAMLLSIHETKHFDKVKDAENSAVKAISRPYLPAPENKEQPKIEPWASPKTVLPLSPKTEEAPDMDAKGIYPKIPQLHKKTSFLLSCKGDMKPSPLHTEIQQRKPKKKSFMGFSTDHTLGFETQTQKGHLPKGLTNNHLNTSSLYTTCLTRVKGASLQPPKSEWRLCKEEPVFYTHN